MRRGLTKAEEVLSRKPGLKKWKRTGEMEEGEVECWVDEL